MSSEQGDDRTDRNSQSSDADDGLELADSSRYTGIFGGNFEAYRTVTDQDYQAVLTSGLVVLDTNVLLDLYRYHRKTSEELLGVLKRIKDQLWVPNHVMNEFLRRRESVIESRSTEVADTVDAVGKLDDSFKHSVRTWANRIGLPEAQRAEVEGLLAPSIENAIERIRELTEAGDSEQLKDTATDLILTELSEILDGRVAVAPSDDEIKGAKAEAIRRADLEKPPGWKDAKKKDNSAGDYLIWRETLHEAKRRGVDVLFVTGDVKEDWWRIDRGQTKGPHPDLVGEMRSFAGVRLFMLRPESLLKRAGDVLNFDVNDESVRDIQRVTVTQEFRWNILRGQRDLLRAASNFANSALALNATEPNSAMGSYLRRHAIQIEQLLLEDEPLQSFFTQVWGVLSAFESFPIFANGKLQRLSGLERDTVTAIEDLREAAIQTWLELKADEKMQLNPVHPEAVFVRGELPPGVTSVAVQPVVQDSEGVAQVEFIATTNFGPRYTTTRVVPLSNAD